MTTITRPLLLPRIRPIEGVRGLVRGSADEAVWVRPAFAGVLALAAVLYLWNLTVSGYANTYYSAAALAASQSWSAWFFGSFDANNFITVDKPPLGTMLMGLSVRLLGLSSWSVLLPQALAGVATVGVLFVAVKHSFGAAAATIAAVVMALTPAAVLIFRFNNPDALLTLLFVLSAWALLRSLKHGGYRWMALAAACVGLAFLTKYLQAYLVLPGYALVFAFSANTTLRRRIVGLGVALATVLVTSGWWVAIVEMLPAGSKPFIGGSTTGSPLDLIFGYDGLGRIFGGSGPGGGGGGGGFSGEVGPLRLFNDQMFGQIAWFIPLAIVCLVVGLYRRRWAERTDRALAGYLLWGSWLIVTAVVFSYMSGVIHSYYAVALAPAIGALVGAGLVELWSTRLRIWLGGIAVGIVCLGTAWFGATLLDRTPTFAVGLGPVAIALAALALALLIATSVPAIAGRAAVKRIALAAAGVGVCATLLAPAAYALDTMGSAYGGGDPHPGPGTTAGFGGPGGLGGGSGPIGGLGLITGNGGGQVPGGLPGDGGGLGGNSSDTALLNYLVSNRGSASWIVAANSAQEAGSIELATGLPVMAMGGFTGSDPAPTLAQLQSYIASGKLRFVLASGGMGGGGFGGGTDTSDRTSWVTSTCKAVSYGGSASLYDCAGAAG
ncbi:MAG: glycosyltransferase family 39 protein [Candidatus Limnocylindrales bacterium]|jgi:4-amino-4-deoxy-L-arabinose transferase-like glycosyltransferase